MGRFPAEDVLEGEALTPSCDRRSRLVARGRKRGGLRPSNPIERPAFESKRDPLLDLCGDALIDGLLTEAW